MIHLDLTDEQAATLISLLRQTVSDLGMAIAATERLEFRDQLKDRRHVLNELLEMLQQSQARASRAA